MNIFSEQLTTWDKIPLNHVGQNFPKSDKILTSDKIPLKFPKITINGLLLRVSIVRSFRTGQNRILRFP